MDNKIVFAIMTIIFNQIGVPNFLVGDKNTGIKKIIFGVISLGVIAIINAIQGIIQGIKILQMSDEDFAAADKKSFLVGIPKAQ